jgi:predicted O-linked N-acetylglucosamine transferase (SPINDLY family)
VSDPISDYADMLGLSGDYEKAIAQYRAVLKERPDDQPALRKLAGALQALGSLGEAESLYRRVIALNPDDARAHEELGRLFGARGEMKNASESLRLALKLDPNLISARALLGDALCRQGPSEEGIAELEKAASADPNNWPVNFRLGVALTSRVPAQCDRAIDCFRRVLAIVPNHAMAHVHLATALQKQGDFASAVALAERALRIDPKLAAASAALGALLHEVGRHEEAVPHLEKALAATPNDSDLAFRLGACLCHSPARFQEGLQHLKRTVELDPGHLKAHIELCSNLSKHGYREGALARFHSALEVFPDDPTLRLGAAVAELPIVCDSEAELESSRQAYRVKLDDLARFFSSRAGHAMGDAQVVGTAQPFYVGYQGRNDCELQARYGEIVTRIMSRAYPEWAKSPELKPRGPEEPIRLGIVSGLFHGHSVLKVPIWGWLALLDRKRFRLFGYYTADYQDVETSRTRRYFDQFVQGPLPVERWCERIRADAPHVLIFPEVGMDPTVPKLAALRLAPIQCTGQGHPVTSGFPTIDYYLGSTLMEPEDADSHYTEKLIRLPNLGVAYIPPPVTPSALRRETFGLRPGGTVYLCCQSLPKYLPQFDRVFVEIARQISDAQFVFVASLLGPEVTARFYRRLAGAFTDAGLDIARHVVMLTPMKTADFLGMAKLCDVFLDGIGWSGYNSTLECLMVSLPVVTWPTKFMRGRHSYAILKMMGVTETVASSLSDYVEIAVRLANDVAWRNTIRQKVSDRRHLLYADSTPVRALEDWLDEIVRRPMHGARSGA